MTVSRSVGQSVSFHWKFEPKSISILHWDALPTELQKNALTNSAYSNWYLTDVLNAAKISIVEIELFENGVKQTEV